MGSDFEAQCRAANAEVGRIHERAGAGSTESVRRGIDAAFGCAEQLLRGAIDPALRGTGASCPSGADYTLERSRVEPLLADVWSVCSRLLQAASASEDDAQRLQLAGVSAHLMRDVLEPQFRAYPEYRSRYGV